MKSAHPPPWTARDSSPLSPGQFIAPVFLLLLALFFSPSSLAANPDQIADGRVLIHRFNCAACHAEFPPGIAGPDLAGIVERLEPGLLPLSMGNPQALQRGSRMPNLFDLNRKDAAENEENFQSHGDQIKALTHYLRSTKSPVPLPAVPPGDVVRGETLFNSVGCAACHQPNGLDPLDTLDRASSLHPALVDYLLHPRTTLMPSLKLTLQEAADLSSWIQHDADVPPVQKERSVVLSPALVKKGRDLFLTRRCVSCHDAPENALPDPLPPIVITDWNAGCLSLTPHDGIPDYELSNEARAAITAAAKSPLPQSPAEIIDHTLATYNCYACHQRGGKGGPSDELRPFFTVTEQMAESYGDFGNIPPKLDHVGRKLTRAWLRKILVEGHGEVRPYLATRMPHYKIPTAEIEKFIDALEKVDQRDPPITIDVSGLPRHQRGHLGRDLMGTKGLNCITCHGLKDRRALGAPNIDLTQTVQRLRPEYFKELLLDPQSVQPGTLMPPLFLNRPKANQEIEQLWTYFKELDQRRLPDGLLRTGDFELKPEEAGKPIVLRTFLEGVGTHAIAVGFPSGTHLAFDARTSQWALLWRGRFLDAMSTWDDRYATPAKPLGDEIYRMPPEAERARVFHGFRLTKNGSPVFLYTEEGEEIEDSIDGTAPGPLVRVLRRGQDVERFKISIVEGAINYERAK